MIDYACPDCSKKAFEAEVPLTVLVRWKCGRCSMVVTPVRRSPWRQASPMHRTYRCSSCKRLSHVERPTHERTYCVECGTETLETVAELGPPPTQRPAEARAEVPTRT